MAHHDEKKPAKHGLDLTTRQWISLVLAIVLALFFVLNLQKVEVDLIVATVELPLVIALGIAALLGMLLAWALRRRRAGSSSR
jgi:uncharacterized integral membrane protein